MQLTVNFKSEQIKAAMDRMASQVPFAIATALNKSAEAARVAVQARMRQDFDRPTPWVLNSMRIQYAKKANLVAQLAFKDKGGDSMRTMMEPHVEGGQRRFKAAEVQLMAMGLLPPGYNITPGAAAKLDSYGNMNPAQIKQAIAMLGAKGSGNAATSNAARAAARLAKGSAKRGQYGIEYFAAPVGGRLPPGIYQRVTTGFGSSLKPVVNFVQGATYGSRLPFYEVAGQTVAKEFPEQFAIAFQAAMANARNK